MMNREEALNTWLPVIEMVLVDANIPEAKEALEVAMQSLEQEPCDDCVSRQYLVEKAMSSFTGAKYVALTDILDAPPVTPVEKVGRWIFVDKAREHAHCSKCDYGNVDLFDGRPHNFCPNCGVKMQEVESEG